MFDWDRDVDTLVAPSACPLYTAVPACVRRSRPVARAACVVLGIAGLVMLGESVFHFAPAAGGMSPARAATGGLRAAFQPAVVDQMPEDLLVYEPYQYENFMRGIVKFSDLELLAYVATTMRDLSQEPGARRGPMEPYLMDVLMLTNREIERRGLPLPARGAALIYERESLLARRQSR